VFVVAHLGEWNFAAKVLFESESVRRNPAPSREAGQGVATNVAPSLTASNDPSRSPQSSEVTQQVNAVLEAATYRMQAFGEYSDDGTASAMKARDYKDATDLVAEPVAYNITFCDANGTRSDRPDGGLYINKTDVTGSLTRAGIGTNVVQPVIAPVVIDRAAFNQGQNAQYKPRIEHSETMDSLVARGPHAVLFENHPNDSRVTGPHDVAPSCVSRYGTGGGNVPLVQEGVDLYNQALTGDVHCPLRTAGGHGAPAALVQEAIPIDLRNANRDPEKHDKINRQGVGVGKIGDPAHTMTKEFTHGVAVAVDTYNQALQEKAAPIRSAASDVCHTGGVINPADRMAVRRLSPRECERLQGFNDDHTLIPWRNKPADQCPDGPRYKALGNSMAVPCMAWIGKRIDAVEKTK
jgi:DNA (cytosine-5)-methyltransferase 1